MCIYIYIYHFQCIHIWYMNELMSIQLPLGSSMAVNLVDMSCTNPISWTLMTMTWLNPAALLSSENFWIARGRSQICSFSSPFLPPPTTNENAKAMQKARVENIERWHLKCSFRPTLGASCVWFLSILVGSGLEPLMAGTQSSGRSAENTSFRDINKGPWCHGFGGPENVQLKLSS